MFYIPSSSSFKKEVLEMEYLQGEERERAEIYLKSAVLCAGDSGCLRAKCGAVIVSQGNLIIGKGCNSPAGEHESGRRCERKKSEYAEKVTDKTCCVHAEQRAIFAAFRHSPNHLKGSTMYFARFDEDMNLSDHRRPYCTICSKMMVDVGITQFVRYQDGDIIRYDTKEYDDLSANYTP